MKSNEIREKTPVELEKLKASLQQELFHSRIKLASGQLDKTHRCGALKRDLARILTIQKEMQQKKG